PETASGATAARKIGDRDCTHLTPPPYSFGADRVPDTEVPFMPKPRHRQLVKTEGSRSRRFVGATALDQARPNPDAAFWAKQALSPTGAKTGPPPSPVATEIGDVIASDTTPIAATVRDTHIMLGQAARRQNFKTTTERLQFYSHVLAAEPRFSTA